MWEGADTRLRAWRHWEGAETSFVLCSPSLHLLKESDLPFPLHQFMRSSVCCCARGIKRLCPRNQETLRSHPRPPEVFLSWCCELKLKLRTKKKTKQNRSCLSGDCQLKCWKQCNVCGFLVVSVVDVLWSDSLEACLCIYASEIP